MRGGLYAVVVWAALAGAVAAGGFVTGLDAVPLMDGLTEDASAALVFDTPDGRIVEARATGPVRRAAVRTFYAAALPQLGWRRRSDLLYLREGERLTITLVGGDGDLAVVFALRPDAPSP